ncbi:hypothetical protein EVAR_54560_1 [Eumeta japonica]|uniref:SWIM-type domain-containing protein n=1 Tax=Eumeta variegata TaxID=151549 RepID=A0A4C1ZRP6_EUMVA|nr:hypothetical protein EVAR_54560_1 [Eumeta japonica]
METGFIKGSGCNLPKIDSLMVASFFARNNDFCAAELRNVKMSLSSRESYGDDAVGYVQLKRESNICTVKCRVCPEHKVRSKPYTVTIIVDEKNSVIISSQCHDCAASAGGCKHAVAFLMWLHRRSEEPSCTQVQCYWKKLVKKVEEYTRHQSSSSLWHELRFGRITASKAYEVKMYKSDGSLVSLIMGGNIPETPAMKRGKCMVVQKNNDFEFENKESSGAPRKFKDEKLEDFSIQTDVRR